MTSRWHTTQRSYSHGRAWMRLTLILYLEVYQSCVFFLYRISLVTLLFRPWPGPSDDHGLLLQVIDLIDETAT